MVPSGARRKNPTHRWPSRPSTLATRSQPQEAERFRAGIGRENFGAGIEAFWRRIIDDPNAAFPPELWQLFLQSNLTALWEKCRPVCVGMPWRRLLTDGAMRQWRPRLEETNREARQYGVGVRGGGGAGDATRPGTP